MKKFKPELFLLLIIVLIGLFARLYKLDNPIADWHSWRQADTAAVARNFYKDGFNPLLPRGDDMSPMGTTLPNPERYRLVEFPIYNSLVYFSYVLNGGVDEKLARLISAIMSLGSIVFIYFIVKRYFGVATALLSSFAFALLPFNIYFSRVTLPEPSLVFFSLGMFYFTDLWILKNSAKLYFASVFFTAGALLLKPMAVFYLLPLIYSYYQKEGTFWPIPRRYFLWALFSFLPFVGWRLWISQHPEGIPASNWLLNGNGIRFRPAFWRWIIGDRLGREILTAPGIVLFFIGLLRKVEKEGAQLHLLALSAFLYLIVFATGNVQHDYYQTIIVPPLVIFFARGFYLLIKGIPNYIGRIWTIPLAVLFFVLTFYFGWNEVKGLYQINNWAIVEAGREADKILPKDAVVVAPYMGDTAFLYQTNRPGWPIFTGSAEDMKKSYGITHFVSVNYDNDTNALMKRYTVMEKTPLFVIIDLTRENTNYTQANN